MKYSDVATVMSLCQTHGVIEVIAAVEAHCAESKKALAEEPDAIVHQYAPVVNAALVQLVNIRSQYVAQK
jgi:hypothetical protein